MLTAAEIEEWNDMAWDRTREAINADRQKLAERAAKAEQQRDELLRVLKRVIANADWSSDDDWYQHARAAIAKIEEDNNAKG